MKSYTDDPSLVSEIEDKNIKVHKDKYDGLDEKEKKELKDKEAKEILKLKQKTQENLEQYRINERIREAKIAREKYLEESTTPVKIYGNQILVPVTIGYSGREVNTVLLLDTGASITLLYNSVADQLQINNSKSSAARVAGGGIVKTKIAEIEFIKVGAKTYKEPTIMMIDRKDKSGYFHGLLGQDFLSHFNYQIDYSKSIIIWR
ncbi:MAG: clan AA aspartic protease [Desulfobacteraceae bacterium]|nr:clan AA aspartic protease [Desulfobacteraceae bacterium]